MRLKQKFKNQAGLGLVETLAAVAVAIIVLTSIVSLAVFTLRSSTRSKLMLQGTKLASDQLELVRAYRDSRATWGAFLNPQMLADCNGEGAACHIAPSLTLYYVPSVISPGTPLETTVRFYITDPASPNDPVLSGANVVRVTVQVSWTIGGQNQSSYIYTDLSDWRFK